MITIRFSEVKERLLKAQEARVLEIIHNRGIGKLSKREKFNIYKEIILGKSDTVTIEPIKLKNLIQEISYDFIGKSNSEIYANDLVMQEVKMFFNDANSDLKKMKEYESETSEQVAYINKRAEEEIILEEIQSKVQTDDKSEEKREESEVIITMNEEIVSKDVQKKEQFDDKSEEKREESEAITTMDEEIIIEAVQKKEQFDEKEETKKELVILAKENEEKLIIKYNSLKERLLKAYQNNDLNKVSSYNISYVEKIKIYLKVILGKEDLNRIDLEEFHKIIQQINKDFEIGELENQKLRLFGEPFDNEVILKQVETFLNHANYDTKVVKKENIEYQNSEKERVGFNALMNPREKIDIITVKFSDLKARLFKGYQNKELDKVSFKSTKIEEKLRIYFKIILGKSDANVDCKELAIRIREILKDFSYDNLKAKQIELTTEEKNITKQVEQFLKTAYKDTKSIQTERIEYQKRTEQDKKQERNLYIEHSEKIKKNVAEEKIYYKSMKKLAPAIASFGLGAAVGIGASIIVPNIAVSAFGMIRITYSLVKYGNKLYSKKVLNGQQTALDKLIAEKKEVFQEKCPQKLYLSLQKMNLLLKKREVQLFLNGLSVGYVAGNMLNLHNILDSNKLSSLEQTAKFKTPEKLPNNEWIRQDSIASQNKWLKTSNIIKNNSPSNIDWLKTGENIDLSKVNNGFTDYLNAISHNNSTKMITKYATKSNGTFIESFRLSNGNIFTGEVKELIKQGIDPNSVAVKVANQNGSYGWLNLQDILDTYGNAAGRVRVK